MKALGIIQEGKGVPKGFDKKPLLEKFRSRSFFLVDVCYEPLITKRIGKGKKQSRKRSQGLSRK